jgi:putative transposase
VQETRIDHELHRAGLAVGDPYVESFNARSRDELLAITEFCDLTESQVLIEDWIIEYNTERPHPSLGDLTPVEFHRAWTGARQPEPALS